MIQKTKQGWGSYTALSQGLQHDSLVSTLSDLRTQMIKQQKAATKGFMKAAELRRTGITIS